MPKIIRIGENLNVMSKVIGPALKARDRKPVVELVEKEVEAGVDYIDLNIGPARKGGAELMEWLVKTVQEVCDLPCSLDTTNPDAMEAGLKVHRGKALINSISLQPERLERMLPMAKQYEASVIALLWGKEGMPRDANERAAHTVDFMTKAAEIGIPEEDIWVDPIVTPVSVEINQVLACQEFMSMLSEICPSCKSTVGLSNISNGTPAKLRPVLNRTYLIMLSKYGLYSAIVDAFDEEIKKICNGEMDDICNLVYRIMDGEEVDIDKLSDKEKEYAKTTKVLLGKIVYSHSWLEL